MYARHYPLAMVWYEAQVVRERVNVRIATEATLIHAAIVAVVAPKGKGTKALDRMLKRLTDGQ